MQKPWQKLGLPRPKSEASRGKLSMIDWEVYSGVELPSGPVFVRLDGWKFHNLCRRLKLEKPFDKNFAHALVSTSKAFFDKFNANLAYIFSDEINLLFLNKPGFNRVEKIDSVFAGLASVTFSKFIGAQAVFDCRCIPMFSNLDILNYLIWRQAECFRNHNNAWAQQKLIQSGLSAARAQKILTGMKTAQIDSMLKERFDFNLRSTPQWQRNGILLYKQKYKKKGFDPIKKKTVEVWRKRIVVNWQPPLFKENKELIERCLNL